MVAVSSEDTGAEAGALGQWLSFHREFQGSRLF
jgi:hypothetical protein